MLPLTPSASPSVVSAARLHERLEGAKPPHVGVTRHYGADQSGTKEYRFNSLGFRSEEFAPLARKRIFACGCSMTFGMGVDLEETWPHRFREKYAAHYRYDAHDVNVLNFGEGGASNNRTVHTVLPQCDVVRPDLLLVQFTYPNRTDYLLGPMVSRIGIWLLEEREQHTSEWLHTLDEAASHYYAFYSDEWGFASSLRDILLLQTYCKARAIPYLFWWVIDRKKEVLRHAQNPVCVALNDLIDPAHFCDMPLEALWCDNAADERHPGPKTHEAIAGALFDRYRQLASHAGGWNQAPPGSPPGEGEPRGGGEAGDEGLRDREASPSTPKRREWLDKIRKKLQGIREEDPNTYPLYTVAMPAPDS